MRSDGDYTDSYRAPRVTKRLTRKVRQEIKYYCLLIRDSRTSTKGYRTTKEGVNA